MNFSDKGDHYSQDGRFNVITCGECGETYSVINPLDDLTCSCGRVLNGVGRMHMKDAKKKKK